jgi:hypothetical protein
MTLLDRCTNIRAQIARRAELRRADKEAEAFRLRTTELQEVREGLAHSIEKLVVLKEYGLPIAGLPTASTAIAVLDECRAKLAENAVESGRDYGKLKRAIEKVGRDLGSVVEKTIERIKKDIPAIEETFLRQVEMIPGYATRVANIRQQRDALLSGDPGASAHSLKQFLDRRDALKTLSDDLQPQEFPPEVLEFFRAGRHGGAPLDKLTDAVRQWLADRDLIKNVRVTVLAR